MKGNEGNPSNAFGAVMGPVSLRVFPGPPLRQGEGTALGGRAADPVSKECVAQCCNDSNGCVVLLAGYNCYLFCSPPFMPSPFLPLGQQEGLLISSHPCSRCRSLFSLCY